MPSFWEIALSDERDDGRGPARHLARRRDPTIPGAVPRAESLFEPVRDRYGWRLALVFGNHAPGGFCPYYTAERCFHCDIGAGEGAAFDLTTNRQRLAWFREYYQPHLASISHLVLYNSGSVLNPREMPPELLDEIVAFARSLPAVRVISLDSREAYIRPDGLRRILSVLATADHGPSDSRHRIGRRSDSQRGPAKSDAAHRHRPGIQRPECTWRPNSDRTRIGLDVNIVIAGPGTTPETAVEDAVMTARYALTAGAEHGVKVDLNLHPYYVGSRGSARFPDHPRCSLATTVRAVTKIAELVRSMAADSSHLHWLARRGPRPRARAAAPAKSSTLAPPSTDSIRRMIRVCSLPGFRDGDRTIVSGYPPFHFARLTLSGPDGGRGVGFRFVIKRNSARSHPQLQVFPNFFEVALPSIGLY